MAAQRAWIGTGKRGSVVTDDVQVNHPVAVMFLGDELVAATLDAEMAIVVGIEAAKRTARDVRNLELSRPLRRSGRALSANMRETVTPWKFSVEGEAGSE